MYKNEMTIAGFVGQPPVIKTVKNNMQLCSLSIAVIEKKGIYPNQTKETIWYKVTVFGNDAIAATSMIAKGDNVMVVGKPSVNSYLNKAGESIVELNLTANKIYKIEDIKYKAPAAPVSAPQATQPAPQPAPQPSRPVYTPQPEPELPPMPEPDDDLPF